MYHLNELPSLPADPRLGEPVTREPFIDEATVSHMMQRQQADWQEQYYFGEDFAGRDDCSLDPNDALTLTARQQFGAFFIPVEESSETIEKIVPRLQPATATAYKVGVNWRRTMAFAAASVVVFATAMTGLWMAQADVLAEPSNPPSQSNAASWTSHEAQGNAKAALIVIDKGR